MNMVEETVSKTPAAEAHPDRKRHAPSREIAFDRPRDFLQNRFVYAVISSRAGGLSLGVNMNPDKYCNFDCVYCEVDRRTPSLDARLDTGVMAAELQRTLAFVLEGRLRELPHYQSLPPELLQLRHVALSGDGEPTLSPNFAEAVQAVVHVRAQGGFPFFKIVLITNGTGLDRPHVQESLKRFTKSDEVWIKLDGGTERYLNQVCRFKDVALEKILSNILDLGRQRPVVIQSLFPAIRGEGPPPEEIEQFTRSLKDLKRHGAQISLVQIYSATRPMAHAECGHLPLKALSQIAHTVRQATGLKAEVF
ncbi:MAG: radical SAM protein [Verrucomicrobiota bacterium]|nr:radical SAM protein [Verrucomicrobiota bacterium]